MFVNDALLPPTAAIGEVVARHRLGTRPPSSSIARAPRNSAEALQQNPPALRRF
jgi:hypothetical protein